MTEHLFETTGDLLGFHARPCKRCGSEKPGLRYEWTWADTLIFNYAPAGTPGARIDQQFVTEGECCPLCMEEINQ